MTFWKTVRNVTYLVLVFVGVCIIIIFTPAGNELIFPKMINESSSGKDYPIIEKINKYDKTLFYLPKQTRATATAATTTTKSTTTMANTSSSNSSTTFEPKEIYREKNYNMDNNNNNNNNNHSPPPHPPPPPLAPLLPFFTPCDSGIDHKLDKQLNNSDCLEIDFPVYREKFPHRILLNPKRGQGYILPNSHDIPRQNNGGGENKLGYCGYGYLLFNQRKREWSCYCMIPELFGGKTCDVIQKKLIEEYNCKKVAHIYDTSNTDVSTFNPIMEGFCSECAFPEKQITVKNPVTIPHCINTSS